MDALSRNLVLETKDKDGITYICAKERPIKFVQEGWIAASRYIIEERGYRLKRWNPDGLIQIN